MKRILVSIIILMCVLLGGWSNRVSQQMIPMESSVYADMDVLYLLSAMGTPSNARPWTNNEANMILARIDVDSLSGPIKLLYEDIAQALSGHLKHQFSDGFSFGVGVDLYAEGYYHTNEDTFVIDTDWVYGFEDRKPMARLRFDFAIDEFFYTYCDLQYGRNRFTDRDGFLLFSETEAGIGEIIKKTDNGKIVIHSAIYSAPFLTNIMTSSYDIDFQTPKRALLTVGGKNWNFSLARDKISWGNGKIGNFIFSDHVDYQEYSRFVAFTQYFKYDWTTLFFETNPSNSESFSADEEFRMLMAHRLEFRIRDRFTFAVSENIMYRNNVFDMRHLNPANIYHNLNSRTMFNAIAHIEVDYLIAAGLNVYGQYCLDQAVAPNEAATQADAYGYLFGVEYAFPLSSALVTTSLEYALASPALYRRDLIDFLMFRRYHGNGTSFITHVDYIGFKYGGDVQVIQWETNMRISPHVSSTLTILGMRKGEITYFTSNDDVNQIGLVESTPTGDTYTDTLITSLSGKYSVAHILNCIEASLWGRVDWVQRRVFTRQTETYSDWDRDVQLSVGLSLSY